MVQWLSASKRAVRAVVLSWNNLVRRRSAVVLMKGWVRGMRKAILHMCVFTQCLGMVASAGTVAKRSATSKPAAKKVQAAKKTPAAKAVPKKTTLKKPPQSAKTATPKPSATVVGNAASKPASAAAAQAGAKHEAGSAEVQTPADSKTDAIPGDACTSLIVDATGLKLDKCMSPKVVRQDGTVVWGVFAKLSEEQYSILQDRGMASYVTTVDEAKSNARAGTKPLVLKAVGSTGKGMKSDLIVSDADAQQLLAENDKGKFLEAFNVILVRNEKPPAAEEPVEAQPAEGEPAAPQQ